MSNATTLYRIIKAIQGFILVVLGIVFCVFFQSEEMKSALSYCVASVLLVYAILTICFAYLFQRGIASSDMISGVVLTSISVFIYINPEIVTQFLPTLFGTILVTYSVLILIETLLYSINKNKKKAILYLVAALLFLGLGITIIILGNIKSSSETTTDILVLIIGIIVLIIGIFITIFSLIAPRREVILTSNTLVKTKEVEQPKTPSNLQKPRKTKAKRENNDNEDIKQIENKSND